MTYDLLSDSVTVFEEAFAALLLENNFKRWIYIAEKEIRDIGAFGDTVIDGNNDDITTSSSEHSRVSIELENIDSIPDLLYQQKVKQRKDNKETAGKWTQDGMVRLNELLSKITTMRNTTERRNFEVLLQADYVTLADSKMEVINRKQKQQLEDMDKANKKVVVKNVLDIVAL